MFRRKTTVVYRRKSARFYPTGRNDSHLPPCSGPDNRRLQLHTGMLMPSFLNSPYRRSTVLVTRVYGTSDSIRTKVSSEEADSSRESCFSLFLFNPDHFFFFSNARRGLLYRAIYLAPKSTLCQSRVVVINVYNDRGDTWNLGVISYKSMFAC